MGALAVRSGRSRLLAVLVVACASAGLAACSETTGTVKPSAAITTTNRSEFVDAGQPIVLSGGSLAAAEAPAAAGIAQGQQPAAPAAAASAEAPRMATAMVEPSTSDIATPEPQPDVTALPDPAVSPAVSIADTGGPLVEPPASEVLSDGPATAQQMPAATREISSDAKAKLVGELQALKKRPGVGQAAAAAGDDCPEGSLEPQCLAAAD